MSLDNLMSNVGTKLNKNNEETFELLQKVASICGKEQFQEELLLSKGFKVSEINQLLDILIESATVTITYHCHCLVEEDSEIYNHEPIKCELCNETIKNTFIHEITKLYTLKEELFPYLKEREEELIKEQLCSPAYYGFCLDLKKNIRNIIPFLGSGTSMPLGLSNWRGLLKGLENGFFNEADKELYRDFLQDGDFMQALGFLKNRTLEFSTDEDIKNFMVDQIEQHYLKDLDKSKHNIEDILNLSSDFIMTTNYDRALLDYRKEYSYPYTFNDIGNVQEFLNRKKQAVVSLHGHIDKKETMIVTDEDYNKLYSDQTTKTILSSIMGNKHLLFLGFSFEDAYFKDLYNKIYEELKGTHYMFVANLHEFQAQKLRQKGLRAIGLKVDEKNFNDSYVRRLKFLLNWLIS
ncbi:SIR2 family protein [Priestia megaterium]|uniref:SIR2 family NAD-dependent protein deacylase n=1 Tax=Priestia megaterium TaxID=1404 RepID=UPI00387927B9